MPVCEFNGVPWMPYARDSIQLNVANQLSIGRVFVDLVVAMDSQQNVRVMRDRQPTSVISRRPLLHDLHRLRTYSPDFFERRWFPVEHVETFVPRTRPDVPRIVHSAEQPMTCWSEGRYIVSLDGRFSVGHEEHLVA